MYGKDEIIIAKIWEKKECMNSFIFKLFSIAMMFSAKHSANYGFGKAMDIFEFISSNK